MPSSPASDRRHEEPRATVDPAPAPQAETAPGGAEPGGDVRDDRQALAAELERLRDLHLRARADLDNYRKRTARDVERRVAETREALVRDWLEALDSVERALRLQPEDPGLRAVLDQMEAILQRQGVSRLGAAGEPFDPERHEAVAVQPTERVPDRTIVEVARSGFALGERVLRPAQVVVARATGGER